MSMNVFQLLQLFSEIAGLLQQFQADGTLQKIEDAFFAAEKELANPQAKVLFDKLKQMKP